MDLARHMVLGDFNLLFLGMGTEVAQEFMATIIAMGLFQIIQGLTQDGGPNLI